MRKGWRWLCVGIPCVGLLAALAMPRFDDFEEFERSGTRIEPDAAWAITDRPPQITSHHDAAMANGRARAWRLEIPYSSMTARMASRHYQGRGGGMSESSGTGIARFYARYSVYVDEETGTQTTVFEGTNLPTGSCALLVEEPTGLQAAWRRFKARLRRTFAR